MVRLRLEQLLQERGISRYRLAQMTGTKYPVIDNYYKNRVRCCHEFVRRCTVRSEIFWNTAKKIKQNEQPSCKMQSGCFSFPTIDNPRKTWYNRLYYMVQ